MANTTTTPPPQHGGASPPKYTPAEQRVRQHPDVAKLIAREPVCASMLAEPSIRIWAPPVNADDVDGFKLARMGTNDLFSRTLNTPDTVEQFILFWDESQPRLFPQSLVTVVGDGAVSGEQRELPPTTGEGSAVALSASHQESVEGVAGEEEEQQQQLQDIEPERMDTLHAFVSVGDAISGWPGVVHGGIVATIFDEVMGYVPMLNRIRGVPMFSNSGYMTGYLNTRYHRPVGTSAVLLVTARIARAEGRKCWVEGEIRSTVHGGLEGPVLASCEALFIALTTDGPKL
ncbi:HotDog domain-containing protein [Microdochium trichocladiopsis]|uniref:HotDog domain-containing protein n=1 Tax=Microdochium trichocladiopsis TaxID=1682393 RepID=A0A9P8Y1B3_9PEZI|nr:HotDog domain-containing protein [Microdochium trichocladiopsis]KAH7026661.1 HotDog domain-containing protein [Microdochium trichocladiopsis]